MEDWTPEGFACALRAEIERDGVPVHVSDKALLSAYFLPLLRLERRRLEALIRLGDIARETTSSVAALAASLARSEEFDHTLVEIQALPEPSP